MKTELYYFTGTGNGLFIAKSIKERLEDDNNEIVIVPINSLNLSQNIISNGDRIVIIYPTYVMTAPEIVKKFAGKIQVSDGSDLFLFAHSGGGGAGIAINSIKKVFEDRKIKISNIFETTFPSNSAVRSYSTDQLRKILEKAEDSVQKNIESLVKGKNANILRLSILKKSSLLIGEWLAVFGGKYMKFREIDVDGSCIGCSTCVKVCPVENIKLLNNRPVFSDKCEMCLACVNQCPKKSLSYGKMKKSNMMSYRHPDVKLKELMYR
jgi:ferredoxin